MEKNVLRVLFSALGVVVLLGGLFAPVGVEPVLGQAQKYSDTTRTSPGQGAFAELPIVGQLVTGDLFVVIGDIIDWVLGFLGLIVFALFLFAGFEYATAGADETKTGNATKRMTNAVIGLIIIFLAWILSGTVLNFIDELGDA